MYNFRPRDSGENKIYLPFSATYSHIFSKRLNNPISLTPQQFGDPCNWLSVRESKDRTVSGDNNLCKWLNKSLCHTECTLSHPKPNAIFITQFVQLFSYLYIATCIFNNTFSLLRLQKHGGKKRFKF